MMIVIIYVMLTLYLVQYCVISHVLATFSSAASPQLLADPCHQNRLDRHNFRGGARLEGPKMFQSIRSGDSIRRYKRFHDNLVCYLSWTQDHRNDLVPC